MQLKIILPFVIVFSVVLTLYLVYIRSQSVIMSSVEDSQTILVKDRMNALQCILEHLHSPAKLDAIQQIFASYASEPDFVLLLLTDDTGKIIASTRYQDVGQYWKNPLFWPVADILVEKSILVQLSEHKKYLEAYSSVCHADPVGLRKQICGVLYYRQDLQYHKKIALVDLRRMFF
jgi:hypothetical protein